MTDTPTHRELRVLLGPYALGHLSPDEQIMLRAHLDGCAECRAELAEIEGVARALGTVEPHEARTTSGSPGRPRRADPIGDTGGAHPGRGRGRCPGQPVVTAAHR